MPSCRRRRGGRSRSGRSSSWRVAGGGRRADRPGDRGGQGGARGGGAARATPPSRRPSAGGWREEGQAAQRPRRAPGGRPDRRPRSGARGARSCATSSARSRATRVPACAPGSSTGRCSATECKINPPSQRPLERDSACAGMEYECLAITSRDPGGPVHRRPHLRCGRRLQALPVHVGEGMPPAGRGRRAADVLSPVGSVNVPAPYEQAPSSPLDHCPVPPRRHRARGLRRRRRRRRQRGGGGTTTAAEVETLESGTLRSARTFPTRRSSSATRRTTRASTWTS